MVGMGIGCDELSLDWLLDRYSTSLSNQFGFVYLAGALLINDKGPI